MYISRYQIKNYMGFLDIPALSLSSGMNLVIGENNVGKSSLLESLRLRFTSRPHLSLSTVPHAGAIVSKKSEATVEICTNGEELKNLILERYSQMWIPIPPNHEENQASNEEIANDLFNEAELRFEVIFSSTNEGKEAQVSISRYPSHGLFTDRGSDSKKMFLVEVNSEKSDLIVDPSVNLRSANGELGLPIAQLLRDDIYFFQAERLHIARGTFGSGSILRPDAQNLAEVLQNLQGKNPSKFDRLIRLVRSVIPTVKYVTVIPDPGISHGVEIRIWPVDRDTERQDLTFSLDQCGTGISQVLAILYVVMTSDRPMTMLIDEPASFLNPGAARKLMDILHQQRQHQYIVSTHSPEVMGFGKVAQTLLVTLDDGVSSVEQLEADEVDNFRRALKEVGARLADVYGADQIVWVEGETEQECFDILARTFDIYNVGTTFVGVRDTGSFVSRTKREEIINIYNRLSSGRSLLPKTVAFLFDREELSSKDLEDLERQGVRFLPRRMYENYLIDAYAITEVLNQTETFRIKEIEVISVQKWLNENGGKESVVTMDGAELLAQLFLDLTDAKEEFRKTLHSVQLTRLLVESDPERFEEIRDLLYQILQSER